MTSCHVKHLSILSFPHALKSSMQVLREEHAQLKARQELADRPGVLEESGVPSQRHLASACPGPFSRSGSSRTFEDHHLRGDAVPSDDPRTPWDDCLRA